MREEVLKIAILAPTTLKMIVGIQTTNFLEKRFYVLKIQGILVTSTFT